MTQPKLLNGKIVAMPLTKYDDESHRKLRDKLRNWRRRNRAKLQQQREHKRLAAGRQRQQSKAQWRLYERTTLQGNMADVLLIRDGEPVPSGYGPSRWLPSTVLPFHLARSLCATRRRQLREWFAARGQ